jgi:hypothetical protein
MTQRHPEEAAMDRDDSAIRASDAERTTTAELLRRHHAEGRLDTDELEERIERCYAAKRRGELDALTRDLPRPQDERPRSRARRSGPPRPLAALVAVGILIAISITTGAHALWLVWPLAFFTFGRFRPGHGWARMEHSRSTTRRPPL